VARKIV